MTTQISDEWLGSVGFKWHQVERQPCKHWTLWLGDCLGRHAGFEDLGIEVTPVSLPGDSRWHCWVRADYAGRYSRFLHVRYVEDVEDVELLVTGLIGRPFSWSDVFYGSLRTPEMARALRLEHERIDWRMAEQKLWPSDEKDDSRSVRKPL